MESLQRLLRQLRAELAGMTRTLAETNRQVGSTLVAIRAERAARARHLAVREQYLALRRATRARSAGRDSG